MFIFHIEAPTDCSYSNRLIIFFSNLIRNNWVPSFTTSWKLVVISNHFVNLKNINTHSITYLYYNFKIARRMRTKIILNLQSALYWKLCWKKKLILPAIHLNTVFILLIRKEKQKGFLSKCFLTVHLNMHPTWVTYTRNLCLVTFLCVLLEWIK